MAEPGLLERLGVRVRPNEVELPRGVTGELAIMLSEEIGKYQVIQDEPSILRESWRVAYLLGISTQQVTALIPGFYGPELEAINHGQEPEFPEVGSSRMRTRLTDARAQLLVAINSNKPIKYRLPELTDAGSAWIQRNAAEVTTGYAEFSQRKEVADSLHGVDVEGFSRWTCCDEHKALGNALHKLTEKGFQASVLIPNFYRSDQQADLSKTSRLPSVPKVFSDEFMRRMSEQGDKNKANGTKSPSSTS